MKPLNVYATPATSAASGINPTLAALEMLLYPKSALVLANLTAAQGGFIEIVPVEAPLTLFVWGPTRVLPVRITSFSITEEAFDTLLNPTRVLPVRITSFSITEEAFDTLLNPTRAKVDLTLQVLSYYDLKKSNPGFSLFMAYQIAKEAMATTNVFNSVQNIGSSLKIF